MELISPICFTLVLFMNNGNPCWFEFLKIMNCIPYLWWLDGLCVHVSNLADSLKRCIYFPPWVDWICLLVWCDINYAFISFNEAPLQCKHAAEKKSQTIHITAHSLCIFTKTGMWFDFACRNGWWQNRSFFSGKWRSYLLSRALLPHIVCRSHCCHVICWVTKTMATMNSVFIFIA